MRVIARLDVKNEYVIKGIHLEGLRKVGDPNELALKYYEEGIDELLFMDAVASLYDRNNLFSIIDKACNDIFVPLTLGGGIRTIADIDNALKAGADKVAINTAAIKTPELIEKASQIYGKQCIVGSIEAKRKNGFWEAYIDNGREPTGKNVIEWAQRLEKLGAGEIIVTSIDQEGTKKGFDLELIQEVEKAVKCPIVVSGGYGDSNHLGSLLKETVPSGVAIASVLHYEISNVSAIKLAVKEYGVEIRP